MAGPATLYQTGNHAGRPAAGSGCVLYTCTDHNLVYRDDGSSWSTFITLASGIADTTFNAKGDILSASADDTPAILSVGSNGSILRAASGQTTGLEWQKNNLAATAAPGASDDNTAGYSVGSAWFDTTNDEVYFAIDVSTGAAAWKQVGSGGGTGLSTGSSFPVSPSTGDRYRRSDLAYQVFFYDGTRWLSEEVFRADFGTMSNISAGPTNSPFSPALHVADGFQTYLMTFQAYPYVNGTNNGSNYWTATIRSWDSASSATDEGSVNTSAGAGTTVLALLATIDTVLATGQRFLDVQVTETGSAGNLYLRCMATYRLIAT